MGLNAEQIEERRKGIGGSDAKTILDGNWKELYRQKKGIEDLAFDDDQQFRMDLGTAAEPVIRDRWASLHPKHEIEANQRVASDKIPYIAANLDSIIVPPDTDEDEYIQEIKFHTGMKSIDELIEFYYGQIQHNMFAAGCDKCEFTVGFGAWGKFGTKTVERDEAFLAEYLQLCESFWWHVENDVEPEDQEGVEVEIEITEFRKVDFEGNNMWADLAAEWIENGKAKKKFENATKEIKELIETDVNLAFGHGIKAKKNKTGSITISKLSKKDLEEFYPNVEKKEIAA